MIDYMSDKVMMTGVHYTDLLHQVRTAVKEKCRGNLTNVVFA